MCHSNTAEPACQEDAVDVNTHIVMLETVFFKQIKLKKGAQCVHAGEFFRLLKELAPDEAELYAEGALDVEEEINKLSGK